MDRRFRRVVLALTDVAVVTIAAASPTPLPTSAEEG
jgi:hypothetical protein